MPSERYLGRFRNTYYNFPEEAEFLTRARRNVTVFGPGCRALARVPESFHNALCVQGSGQLASGQTLSFFRRDCDCAARCPTTGQHICFEALSPQAFPWGRGATGAAIRPLRTVAVDSKVIALHTPLYIPEYEGLPRADAAEQAVHDGCFLAEDRGSGVRGRHIDIFTGTSAQLRDWNARVPSNRGVSVFVSRERCAHLLDRQPRDD